MLHLYYTSFDEKLSAKDRYEWYLLHTFSCLLRNCFRGSTFPFSLSLWLTGKFVSTEYIVEGVLALPDDMWVKKKIIGPRHLCMMMSSLIIFIMIHC